LQGKAWDGKGLDLTEVETIGPLATAKRPKQGEARLRSKSRMAADCTKLGSFNTAAGVDVGTLTGCQRFAHGEQTSTAPRDTAEVLINTLHSEKLSKTTRANRARSNFRIVRREPVLSTSVAMPARRVNGDVSTLVTEETFILWRWSGGRREIGADAAPKSVHTTQMVVHAL